MTHKNGLEKPHVIKVVDNPTPEIWAHLNEFPDYYTRLAKREAEAAAEAGGTAQGE